MSQPQGIFIIERILRDREGVWRQIAEDTGLRRLAVQMLISSAIALALYGAVLGASSDWRQALLSAVKLPMLFFVTLAICLPTLYLFNLVFGAKLSWRQAMALICVGITVIAMLSLAFAPISLFFLVTAPHYSFFKLLNVAILALTGLVGLRFLVNGMRAMNAPAPAKRPAAEAPETGGATVAEAPRAANMGLLYMWIVVFGFVGTQLAWTLRPFVGSPGEEFELFRSIEGNFYVDIGKTILNLF